MLLPALCALLLLLALASVCLGSVRVPLRDVLCPGCWPPCWWGPPFR